MKAGHFGALCLNGEDSRDRVRLETTQWKREGGRGQEGMRNRLLPG